MAEFGGIRCKVFSTDLPLQTTDAAPGTILEAGKRGIDIACGGGTVLHIDELQADGGKRMKAADYLRESGAEVAFFEGVEPDPSFDTVVRGARAMEQFSPDLIVALGGGSPMDAA